MQTGKMQKVPIGLLGAKGLLEQHPDFAEFERMGLISKGDLGCSSPSRRPAMLGRRSKARSGGAK